MTRIKLSSKRVAAYADFYEDFIGAKTEIARTGAKIVFEQIELSHSGVISAILEIDGNVMAIKDIEAMAYLDLLGGLAVVKP